MSQGVQESAPSVLKVFPTHSSQLVWSADLCVPAGQGSEIILFTVEYSFFDIKLTLTSVKMLQFGEFCNFRILTNCYHSWSELSWNVTLPHLVRSSLDTCPAIQEVHEAAPFCSVTEFTGHLVQLGNVPSRYVPEMHSTEEFFNYVNSCEWNSI